MLLQPQHLQQAERHGDHARHVLLRATTPYAWGFSEVEIDPAALTLGKIALVKAVGVFPDGTVFDMPAVDPLPDAIDIPTDMRDEVVMLALPLRRAGAREADVETFEDLVRHKVMEADVPDSNTSGERTAWIVMFAEAAARAHAASASISATGHALRCAACAYTTLKATEASTAASEAAAAWEAKPAPCSIARKKRIGPATTGRPASQPATEAPQRLPASDTSNRKAGTSSSLSASKAGPQAEGLAGSSPTAAR